MSETLLSLRLTAIRFEAEGISSFELQQPDGGELPPFTAGAHIDLHLPNGMVRSYSLCNDSSERRRYVVAVARDANSRGGSVFMHDQMRVGQRLDVGAPRNNFELDERAPHTVLIAGGVGVTPLWCMAQRLQNLGSSWEIHYASRSRSNAAFLLELGAIARRHPGRVHLHFDQEQGLMQLGAVVSQIRADAHVYCCGPLPMLEAFESAVEGLPCDQIHVEYFKAKDEPVTAGGVELRLAKSNKVITVGPGKTVLDAILECGVDVPYSCMEGICGSCEVAVLEGEPDHHDSVLTERQRQSNRTMMVCCSGAKSSRLVLDL